MSETEFAKVVRGLVLKTVAFLTMQLVTSALCCAVLLSLFKYSASGYLYCAVAFFALNGWQASVIVKGWSYHMQLLRKVSHLKTRRYDVLSAYVNLTFVFLVAAVPIVLIARALEIRGLS